MSGRWWSAMSALPVLAGRDSSRLLVDALRASGTSAKSKYDEVSRAFSVPARPLTEEPM
jgi:hypothetical protein